MTDQKKSDHQDIKYWVAFSRLNKIGAVRFKKIIDYFHGDLTAAWQAEAANFIKAGLEEKVVMEIIINRRAIEPEMEWEKLIKEEIKIIRFIDDDYPKLLKEIYNPPPLIYYRGSLNCLNQFCLAVVGTRRASNYGRQAVKEIVADLAKSNITVVSGLALGIDALAHEAALEHQGLTAAVLGSGADWQNIYPAGNRHLAKKIIEKDGCILSEHPLGALGLKHHFPLRNRLISGLSLGTLVIEAGESSGALITAKYALEQNREIFALPGSIYYPYSIGTNQLIKQGAKPITSARDVLEELNLIQATAFTANQKIIPENPEEEMLIKILTKEPIHIDKIARLSKLKVNSLASLLTLMEMKGLVRDLGGKNYILAR